MDDFLQVASGLGVVEHDGANFPAVQCAVGLTHVRAEPANNRRKPCTARGHGVAREYVGVNGRNAEPLEARAHVTLAGGNTARERYARDTSSGHVIAHDSLRLCLDVVEDPLSW
jgi:hypothetical protein